MSEEGRSVAAELKAAQNKALKNGVSQIESLKEQAADINASIKATMKVMEDAGLDSRVVKEVLKRGRKDDRQVALFDMQLIQYENALKRQRKFDLAEPEKKDVDEDTGTGDGKVTSLADVRATKGKKDKPAKGKKKPPAKAAAAEAAPPPAKRGGFRDVTERMSTKDYRASQGLDDDGKTTKH